MGRLEADTDLEASRAPIDKLDRALGLQGRNSAVHFLRNNITTVEQTSSHVLPGAGITLDHLVVGLEARHGDLLYGVRLMCGLGSGNHGSVSDQGEMDTRVGDQVGLELSQIDVERTIESERSSDGGDNYSSQIGQHCSQSSHKTSFMIFNVGL